MSATVEVALHLVCDKCPEYGPGSRDSFHGATLEHAISKAHEVGWVLWFKPGKATVAKCPRHSGRAVINHAPKSRND